MLYRCWSSIRFRHLRDWHEAWVHPSLRGGRSPFEARDVSYEVGLDIELSKRLGHNMWGLQFDYRKHFDLVVRELLWPLAQDFGIDSGILRASAGFYDLLHRRMKLGQHIGPPFCDTNSVLQGCSLSMLWVNLLVTVWARRMEEGTMLPPVHVSLNPDSYDVTPVQDLLTVDSQPQAGPQPIVDRVVRGVNGEKCGVAQIRSDACPLPSSNPSVLDSDVEMDLGGSPPRPQMEGGGQVENRRIAKEMRPASAFRRDPTPRGASTAAAQANGELEELPPGASAGGGVS